MSDPARIILLTVAVGLAFTLLVVAHEKLFLPGARPLDRVVSWWKNMRRRNKLAQAQRKQTEWEQQQNHSKHLQRPCARCNYSGQFQMILDSRSVEVHQTKNGNCLTIVALILLAPLTFGITLLFALFIPFSTKQTSQNAKEAQQCPECGNIRPMPQQMNL